MNKKSQSAMEYLMTYGWAILVVLIALGALFYLGVFTPAVPNTVNIPAPFSYIDILPKTASGSLIIGANGIQADAKIWVVGHCTGSKLDAANGENTVTLTCTDKTVGDVVRGDVKIAYQYTGSDLIHAANGTYSGKIEG